MAMPMTVTTTPRWTGVMPARTRTMCTRAGGFASIARWAARGRAAWGLAWGGGWAWTQGLHLPFRSTTPPASTVSAACRASTAPRTSLSTRRMPASVSGPAWVGRGPALGGGGTEPAQGPGWVAGPVAVGGLASILSPLPIRGRQRLLHPRASAAGPAGTGPGVSGTVDLPCQAAAASRPSPTGRART